ncbi:MAG: DNA repair protein RecO [Bacteroidales bacterium]|nr:DNA repair protein RecO [Bacteroidales bacterium]
MIRKTRGIVLHTTRYGESSLVVQCYTEQHGRQTYMLKGVRKSRKQNRSNLFQPLFILDFEVYHKDSREIQLVKEVTRTIPINSIPYDITKSTQAIFMAEVLYRVIREEEQNPMLSHFLINTIKYLDALEDPSPDFHIIFLFQLSRYLGFYRQNNWGEKEKYFDLLSGHFKSYVTDPEIQLDDSTSSLWSRYIQLDYQGIKNSEFNSSQRKIVLDNLIRYFKIHVPGMGEIRSLEVLHTFFHN